MDENAHMSAS
jgi:hypothetical protein